MIKKKLIGLISTISLVSVVGIASTVSADDSVVELKYNEELSTPTVKVVDVNYSYDGSDLFMFGGKFIADCSEESMDYEPLVPSSNPYECAKDYINEKLTIEWSDMNMVGGVSSSGTHGRVKITVPEGTSEFSVSFTEICVANFDGDEYYPDDITITIPGATVEDEEVTFDATPAGFFTYWQDAPAAKAFYATLTAEQAAKSVTWTVTDGSETKTADTTVDTTITGENDVVIGLVVSNAKDALTATVTVK